MICDNPPQPPSDTGKQIFVAVTSAVIVVVITKAIDWAFDELKEKFGSKKPKKE